MIGIKNIEDGLTEWELEYIQKLRGRSDFLDNIKIESKPDLNNSYLQL